MKDILEKYMFWIFLVYSIASFSVTHYYSLGSWDLNRTIGWGWDITNLIMWNTFKPPIFFLLGYGLILILKRRNLFRLSLLQLGLIMFDLLISLTETTIILQILLYFSIWVVFLLNLILSEKPTNEIL